MDASEYRNIVLGLIFLKYISGRFGERDQQLADEGDGFEEDIDAYVEWVCETIGVYVAEGHDRRSFD